MIEFFSSSPEAIASLLIFALGLLGSTCYLLYTLFANYPVIVQLLANTSLVSVDSVLREKVKVTFEYLGQIREIHELRQMKLEILNSHPRQQLADKTITIHLNSDKVTILGVMATNGNNQTPEAGGRRITTRIEEVPTIPPDHLLGTSAQSFYPALVIHIPYLDKITQNDRIFLQITYNGPFLIPNVQGGEFKDAREYYSNQKMVTATLSILTILGFLFAYIIIDQDVISFLLLGLLTILLLIYQTEEFRERMRTLPNPLIPPPYEPEDLVKLYYHDTMKN